jgi:hypothetical protein
LEEVGAGGNSGRARWFKWNSFYIFNNNISAGGGGGGSDQAPGATAGSNGGSGGGGSGKLWSRRNRKYTTS